MARRVLDVAFVVVLTVTFEWNVWGSSGILGTQIAGPRWLTAALPLLLALPLLWRRRAPFLAAGAVLLAVDLQALASGNSAEGLVYVVPIALAGYSVAAYGTRPVAVGWLALFVPAYLVYGAENHNVRTWKASQLWPTAFFALLTVAFWLAGFFVRSHREAKALAAHAAALEHDAETAVAEERARIARELHDVIAHSVSVIGLQAGAAQRVLDRDPERVREPLQSIQDGAREAVLELRRLLGILRDGEEPEALAPQPRLAELGALLEQVRGTGLAVDLEIDGDAATLSPGVELSAYRIVQEALTNVLKHADATHVHVVLRYRPRLLELEVSDDGARDRPNGYGHGVIGMRERVALYGGALTTGRGAGGGFSVRARLPYDGTAA